MSVMPFNGPIGGYPMPQQGPAGYGLPGGQPSYGPPPAPPQGPGMFDPSGFGFNAQPPQAQYQPQFQPQPQPGGYPFGPNQFNPLVAAQPQQAQPFPGMPNAFGPQGPQPQGAPNFGPNGFVGPQGAPPMLPSPMTMANFGPPPSAGPATPMAYPGQSTMNYMG